MQRHERGDVVGVDGHRSRPLVQARGEGRQDRSSLAMGTARPAAGGGHIALPWGSRGPASPRRPARPRAPAAEPRRTAANDRRMGKRCISPAHPWCSERRGAHGVTTGARLRPWQIWGSAGVKSPCAAAIIMAAARSQPDPSLEGSRRAFENACFLYFGYDRRDYIFRSRSKNNRLASAVNMHQVSSNSVGSV